MTTPRTPLAMPRACARSRSRGMVLVVCLLMLLVMSMLSVSIYRRFDLAEVMAGNLREKQRALEAAQSALLHAEWWLATASLGTMTGASCAANQVADVSTTALPIRVCSNALGAAPQAKRWETRFDYLPGRMAVATGGGQSAVTHDINYYEKPAFYIQYLGLVTGGGRQYRISARGFGATADTIAEVESVVLITSSGSSAGGTGSLGGL